MIRYGTKTINQKIQIDDEEFDITVKVIHNTETPQITMSVKDEKDFFSIELTQVDISVAQTALNEAMNIFRAATGLPAASVSGSYPAAPIHNGPFSHDPNR